MSFGKGTLAAYPAQRVYIPKSWAFQGPLKAEFGTRNCDICNQEFVHIGYLDPLGLARLTMYHATLQFREFLNRLYTLLGDLGFHTGFFGDSNYAAPERNHIRAIGSPLKY